jgi:hypothetical protein
MVLPYNFCLIIFLPSLMVEAVDAPQTLFRAPLTPGVGVQGRNHFKNLSAIKIYTYSRFHPDWSDSLGFYKVRIYIFCALYIRFEFFSGTHLGVNATKPFYFITPVVAK